MSKKANPTTIGLFIILGLALGVAGLIVFSSGDLFNRHERMILYFDSSMKGLNQGAAVKWRGVTVGSVAEVLLRHNQASNDYANPVIIQIDESILSKKSDDEVDLADPVFLKRRIERGLRGKLDAESLVTGVLYVELNMFPNAPAPVFHQLTREYPEIPTAPTEIQELLANLARVDFRGISEKLNALLIRLDTSLGQLDVKAINAGVTNLLRSANGVLASPDLTNSLAELKLLLTDSRGLVKRVDDQVLPLSGSLTNTLGDAQKTLEKLRFGLEQLTGMVEPNAPFRTDITTALDQLGNAGRAIADLADFLHRNPNALLTGRKPPSAQP